MNSRIFLSCALAVLLAHSSLAEGIYKWTDENGVTHYSDMPQKGATVIDVQPVQTFSAPDPATYGGSSSDAADGADEDDEAEGYDSITISSPSDEETIWNTAGNVKVNVSLQPRLQTGHRIRLSVNGDQLELPPRSSSGTLTDIVRGTYSLQAAVLNSNDQVVGRSETKTFYYKQTQANNNPRGVPRLR